MLCKSLPIFLFLASPSLQFSLTLTWAFICCPQSRKESLECDVKFGCVNPCLGCWAEPSRELPLMPAYYIVGGHLLGSVYFLPRERYMHGTKILGHSRDWLHGGQTNLFDHVPKVWTETLVTEEKFSIPGRQEDRHPLFWDTTRSFRLNEGKNRSKDGSCVLLSNALSCSLEAHSLRSGSVRSGRSHYCFSVQFGLCHEMIAPTLRQPQLLSWGSWFHLKGVASSWARHTVRQV